MIQIFMMIFSVIPNHINHDPYCRDWGITKKTKQEARDTAWFNFGNGTLVYVHGFAIDKHDDLKDRFSIKVLDDDRERYCHFMRAVTLSEMIKILIDEGVAFNVHRTATR